MSTQDLAALRDALLGAADWSGVRLSFVDRLAEQLVARGVRVAPTEPSPAAVEAACDAHVSRPGFMPKDDQLRATVRRILKAAYRVDGVAPKRGT